MVAARYANFYLIAGITIEVSDCERLRKRSAGENKRLCGAHVESSRSYDLRVVSYNVMRRIPRVRRKIFLGRYTREIFETSQRDLIMEIFL